jgi:cation diffusion facilitator family transporter
MNRLTTFLVNSVIRKEGNPLEPSNRLKVGKLEGYLSIFSNLFLFGIKLFLGLISQSIALLADAFHTLMDVATSGIVILGFKLSQKPADAEHPFGHGRAETISSLLISFLIGLVGIEFLKSSIARLYDSEELMVDPKMIFIIVVTIVVKEIMARVSHEMGELIESDILKGDAAHHRSDMLSSLLVVVGLIGVRLGWPELDSYMGIGVSVFILYTGYKLAQNAVDELLGKPPTKEMINSISVIATKVGGVLNVHDIIVHQYGVKKFISLHIEVGDDRTADELHIIADLVEDKIAKKMYANVVTHIDPVKLGGNIENAITKMVNHIIKNDELGAIQDLRIMKENGTISKISFEIPCSVEFMQKDEIQIELNQQIAKTYPHCKIDIKFINQISR